MKKIITCLLATFGITTACCQQNYENTDPEGFAKLIALPDVVILDVRTAEEFKEGHIENALNIDVKQSDFMPFSRAVMTASSIMTLWPMWSPSKLPSATAVLSVMSICSSDVNICIICLTSPRRMMSVRQYLPRYQRAVIDLADAYEIPSRIHFIYISE